ncbi:unnamed protein product [Rotaria magnacalcarata]|uniref:NIDO domain-containing protein n=1 Tax=Rotaria magnacalcarata TaxID=392030 RepID=A0A816P4R8_9BILA|nr:unnamed protein product [Rotaria magnacalcarata]
MLHRIYHTSQSPGPFPLRDFLCAAPCWTDTDIVQDSSGNIFNRQISDEATLSQITDMVRNGFSEISNNRMLWAFVATWFRVPGRNLRDRFVVTKEKGNSSITVSTAIITTHGLYSFTIFTYNQLQWSAGAWGGFPQVVSESNIGVTGQFIFRTTGRINDVQCNTTQDLQASPCRGSMHGGYELRLFGICFTDNSYIIEVDGQEVTNCTRTSAYMICAMPMVFEGRSSSKGFTSDRSTWRNIRFIIYV